MIHPLLHLSNVLLLLLVLLIGTDISSGKYVDTDSHEIDYIPKPITTPSPAPQAPQNSVPSLIHLPPPHNYLDDVIRSPKQHRTHQHKHKHHMGIMYMPPVQDHPSQHMANMNGLQDPVQDHLNDYHSQHTMTHSTVNELGNRLNYPANRISREDEDNSRGPEYIVGGSIYGGSRNYITFEDLKTPPGHERWRPAKVTVTEKTPSVTVGEVVTPTQPMLGPRFDRTLPRNVTVQEGHTVILSCRVLDIGQKSVSWIRHEDLHILSVGKYRYSTDDRVSVEDNTAQQEWILKIKQAQPHDAGMYECQVSTKPVLSFIVNLEVVVPRAEILNGNEIFVHRGSLINLTCVVNHGTDKPVYVYWYHNNQVVDYEGRGGVTVITKAARDTMSHLLMRDAAPPDSGTYTCTPSSGAPASTSIHVLNGEHHAAMQQNTSTRTMTSLSTFLFAIFLSYSLSKVIVCK